MAWDFVSAGHQWRNELAKSRVKAFKVTLKQMLSKTLSGDKLTLTYDELCTVLTMAANVVNDPPIALRTRTHGNLVPRTVNQLLSGRASGAVMEPHAVQDELYIGASRNQQDLLNLCWKSWKKQ